MCFLVNRSMRKEQGRQNPEKEMERQAVLQLLIGAEVLLMGVEILLIGTEILLMGAEEQK